MDDMTPVDKNVSYFKYQENMFCNQSYNDILIIFTAIKQRIDISILLEIYEFVSNFVTVYISAQMHLQICKLYIDIFGKSRDKISNMPKVHL